MTGSRWRVLLAVSFVVTVFSVGLVLGLPFSSRAQQPAKPVAAAVPPDSNYVGAETCKGCHEEAFNKFAKTRMGRIFLHQARTPRRRTPARPATAPARRTWTRAGARARAG